MSKSLHEPHYALRSDLQAALRADLLGPQHGPEEILAGDAPITAYPIGVLFPQAADEEAGAELAASADELDGVDAPAAVVTGDNIDDGNTDLGVSLANVRRPSSMGLTFSVDPASSPTIVARVDTAVYLPEDEHGRPLEPRRGEARSTEQQRERWRRAPVNCAPFEIDVTRHGSREPVVLCPGLELRVLVRRPMAPEGVVTVTATLVNTHQVGKYDLQDAYCFFQSVLSLTGLEGAKPFVERPAPLGAVDSEQALSRLLHRHAPYFATGHGCSVAWEWTPPTIRTGTAARAAVSSLRTDFMPRHEVLLTDSNPDIDDSALTMYALGHQRAGEIRTALDALLDGYSSWIDQRAEEASGLAGTDHEPTAKQQIELCRQALARMRRGVQLLADETRPEILESFQLANQAMAQQRARTSWIKSGRHGDSDPRMGTWRPFQIAFMLLCLEGIVDSEHDDRRLADLLWFPTGGGKTEAYLGLVAFTTFLRRLRDGALGGGVTVLMRYTLRLLTLQQFERAATLICAMECLRVERPDRFGREPISIGMWVGSSATPNDLVRAEARLKELRESPGKALQKENPVQLHSCPWCGEPLDASNYSIQHGFARMTIHCPNAGCDFSTRDGLPVHLIDDAVYSAHPTLVIATVDKFASLPWRAETAHLFNRYDSDGPRPPELIIQDELHLISGPLGTLTGLYETAVDVLADRPKVVASTATIRRAADQGRALFDRQVAQFPPAGLDSRDSWFAVETPRNSKASREYVGLLTSSTSQATLLVRTYAALLHAAARSNAPDEVKDAYWTLVGYFNSLRLLSAAELQVLDDVQDRLEFLATRDGTANPRKATALVELSSRADASEIPRRLKHLELGLPHSDTLDVLLATNMISVGVDVDRLGLMAVMGQPQTTAEYIQATSRVGRRHPGLVAVMLNSARSRDRSHYENFPGFHSALYREVESTSVTPFSARSRDRGLHAVIVGLTRVLVPAARSNESAAEVDQFLDEINNQVRPHILARVSSVDSEEHETTARAFDEFIEWWQAMAAENETLVYRAKRGTKNPALLTGFDDEDPDGVPTLWSLRDVDAESTLFLEQ